MASLSISLSSLAAAALLLSLLSSPASARPGGPFHPCNTLFISYTVTTTSSSSSAAAFVSVFRIVRPRPQPQFLRPIDDPRFRYGRLDRPIRGAPLDQFLPSHPHPHPHPHWRPAAVGFSSLQERAKDILVVVVGLLFGVGCGALTAATMYLAWSLVSNRFEVCGYGDEEEEEVDSPKKAGYVKIPAADTKPAKEGYEGN